MSHAPRIKPLDPATVEGKAKEMLDGIQAKLGAVPNIFKTFAHSPAVFEVYLGQSAALNKSSLSPALREQIALTVAGINSCDYCASAHTVIGRKSGVPEDELPAALEGKSKDKHAQAALTFARRILETNGNVSDGEVKAVRDAGFNDAAILEIIATVTFNIFTNYINHIAGTEIDFPMVEAKKKKAA